MPGHDAVNATLTANFRQQNSFWQQKLALHQILTAIIDDACYSSQQHALAQKICDELYSQLDAWQSIYSHRKRKHEITVLLEKIRALIAATEQLTGLDELAAALDFFAKHYQAGLDTLGIPSASASAAAESAELLPTLHVLGDVLELPVDIARELLAKDRFGRAGKGSAASGNHAVVRYVLPDGRAVWFKPDGSLAPLNPGTAGIMGLLLELLTPADQQPLGAATSVTQLRNVPFDSVIVADQPDAIRDAVAEALMRGSLEQWCAENSALAEQLKTQPAIDALTLVQVSEDLPGVLLKDFLLLKQRLEQLQGLCSGDGTPALTAAITQLKAGNYAGLDLSSLELSPEETEELPGLFNLLDKLFPARALPQQVADFFALYLTKGDTGSINAMALGTLAGLGNDYKADNLMVCVEYDSDTRQAKNWGVRTHDDDEGFERPVKPTGDGQFFIDFRSTMFLLPGYADRALTDAEREALLRLYSETPQVVILQWMQSVAALAKQCEQQRINGLWDLGAYDRSEDGKTPIDLPPRFAPETLDRVHAVIAAVNRALQQPSVTLLDILSEYDPAVGAVYKQLFATRSPTEGVGVFYRPYENNVEQILGDGCDGTIRAHLAEVEAANSSPMADAERRTASVADVTDVYVKKQVYPHVTAETLDTWLSYLDGLALPPLNTTKIPPGTLTQKLYDILRADPAEPQRVVTLLQMGAHPDGNPKILQHRKSAGGAGGIEFRETRMDDETPLTLLLKKAAGIETAKLIELLRLLLNATERQATANPNMANRAGETPLFCITDWVAQSAVVDLLVASGAKLQVENVTSSQGLIDYWLAQLESDIQKENIKTIILRGYKGQFNFVNFLRYAERKYTVEEQAQLFQMLAMSNSRFSDEYAKQCLLGAPTQSDSNFVRESDIPHPAKELAWRAFADVLFRETDFFSLALSVFPHNKTMIGASLIVPGRMLTGMGDRSPVIDFNQYCHLVLLDMILGTSDDSLDGVHLAEFSDGPAIFYRPRNNQAFSLPQAGQGSLLRNVLFCCDEMNQTIPADVIAFFAGITKPEDMLAKFLSMLATQFRREANSRVTEELLFAEGIIPVLYERLQKVIAFCERAQSDSTGVLTPVKVLRKLHPQTAVAVQSALQAYTGNVSNVWQAAFAPDAGAAASARRAPTLRARLTSRRQAAAKGVNVAAAQAELDALKDELRGETRAGVVRDLAAMRLPATKKAFIQNELLTSHKRALKKGVNTEYFRYGPKNGTTDFGFDDILKILKSNPVTELEIEGLRLTVEQLNQLLSKANIQHLRLKKTTIFVSDGEGETVINAAALAHLELDSSALEGVCIDAPNLHVLKCQNHSHMVFSLREPLSQLRKLTFDSSSIFDGNEMALSVALSQSPNVLAGDLNPLSQYPHLKRNLIASACGAYDIPISADNLIFWAVRGGLTRFDSLTLPLEAVQSEKFRDAMAAIQNVSFCGMPFFSAETLAIVLRSVAELEQVQRLDMATALPVAATTVDQQPKREGKICRLPQGGYFSGSALGQLSLHAETGELIRAFNESQAGRGEVQAIQFFYHQQFQTSFVVSAVNQSVQIWDVHTGLRKLLLRPGDRVTAVGMNGYFLWAGAGNKVTIYDVSELKAVKKRTVQIPSNNPVAMTMISSDLMAITNGPEIVIVSQQKLLAGEDANVQHWKFSDTEARTLCSLGNDYIAVGCRNGKVKIFHALTQKEVGELNRPAEASGVVSDLQLEGSSLRCFYSAGAAASFKLPQVTEDFSALREDLVLFSIIDRATQRTSGIPFFILEPQPHASAEFNEPKQQAFVAAITKALTFAYGAFVKCEPMGSGKVKVLLDIEGFPVDSLADRGFELQNFLQALNTHVGLHATMGRHVTPAPSPAVSTDSFVAGDAARATRWGSHGGGRGVRPKSGFALGARRISDAAASASADASGAIAPDMSAVAAATGGGAWGDARRASGRVRRPQTSFMGQRPAAAASAEPKRSSGTPSLKGEVP